jgi:hypothetical protein
VRKGPPTQMPKQDGTARVPMPRVGVAGAAVAAAAGAAGAARAASIAR